MCWSSPPSTPHGCTDQPGEFVNGLLKVGNAMLKLAFSLRMALLIASFGAVLGAGLIFWLGFYKLLHSVQEAFGSEAVNTKGIAAGVMGASYASLFGVVLIIFASTITFGFALEMPERLATRLPRWMQVKD